AGSGHATRAARATRAEQAARSGRARRSAETAAAGSARPAVARAGPTGRRGPPGSRLSGPRGAAGPGAATAAAAHVEGEATIADIEVGRLHPPVRAPSPRGQRSSHQSASETARTVETPGKRATRARVGVVQDLLAREVGHRSVGVPSRLCGADPNCQSSGESTTRDKSTFSDKLARASAGREDGRRFSSKGLPMHRTSRALATISGLKSLPSAAGLDDADQGHQRQPRLHQPDGLPDRVLIGPAALGPDAMRKRT